MSSSEEEVTSALTTPAPPPCSGCRHLRRECVPGCEFAPYFSPEEEEDGDRFRAVHGVFGAGNVSKVLREFEPEDRARAVEALVGEATARQKDPALGRRVPHVAFLRNMLRQAKGHPVAERVVFEELAGPAPFDPPLAMQVEEAPPLVPTLQLAKERGDAIGLERPALQNQQTKLQMAEAPKLVAAAEVATGQDMMMRVTRQAAAEEQYYHAAMAQAQQLAAAEQIPREQDVMIRQAAAAAGLTTDQYMMMMMMMQDVAGGQQLHAQEEQYAAMGLTSNQNMTMMQQAVAGQQHHDQARQYAAMGLDVTLRHGHPHLQEQTVQQIANAQQLSASAYEHAMCGSGLGETIMPFLQQRQIVNAQAEEEPSLPPLPPWLADPPREQLTFLPGGSADAEAFPVQPQPQTVNAFGPQEEPSLPPLPPWLADPPCQQQPFLPGGSADAEAFHVQPQPQTVNAFGPQEEPSLPPLPPWLADPPRQQLTFLPGVSADAEALHVQPPQQPQTVNAFGPQEEPSLPPLPPLLAGPPRQQQNDGGDEGQSSDLIARSRFWNEYPILPRGGRQ